MNRNRFRRTVLSKKIASGGGIDPDAQAYYDLVVAQGGTIDLNKCNNLFISLKAGVGLANIWRYADDDATGFKLTGSDIDTIFFIKQNGGMGKLNYTSGTKATYSAGNFTCTNATYTFDDGGITDAVGVEIGANIRGWTYTGASILFGDGDYFNDVFLSNVSDFCWCSNTNPNSLDYLDKTLFTVPNLLYCAQDFSTGKVATTIGATPFLHYGANNDASSIANKYVTAFQGATGFNGTISKFAFTTKLTAGQRAAIQTLLA